MRINRSKDSKQVGRVGGVYAGQVVEFTFAFHQKHKDDDLFMVVDASAYCGHDNQGKKAVVNLRTGALSYVDRERKVFRVPDEKVSVIIED